MYVVTPDIEQAYTVSHAIHVYESCIHVSSEGSALKCIHFISTCALNNHGLYDNYTQKILIESNMESGQHQ